MIADINNREMGNLPVSIGTALAIERMDPDWVGENDERFPYVAPEELWINLKTLFRNFIGSVDRNVSRSVNPNLMIEPMYQEMLQIEGFVRDATKGKTVVKWYSCDYSKLNKEFPMALFKELTTPRQLEYAALESAVESTLIRHVESQFEKINVLKFRTKLVPDRKDVWIMTHLCVDLLWNRGFRSLSLFESHTGKLKTKSEWNTKLTNCSKLDRIPFCRFSIQVFGDKGQFFKPLNKKTKDAVLAVAESNKWTTNTTDDKIRFGLHSIKDPFGKELLLKLV